MKKTKFNDDVHFEEDIFLKIKGRLYRLRVDLMGWELEKATWNREVIIMTRRSLSYHEVRSGFIRAKYCDDNEIAIKRHPRANNYTTIDRADVIAWSYADEEEEIDDDDL